MSSWIAALVATLALLLSVTASAQSPAKPDSPDSDALLARLSYQSTYVVDWSSQEDSPRICFALYRDGHYRMSKLTEHGAKILQGSLSESDFKRISGMVAGLKSESKGGIVREGSESFVAEVAGEGKTVHYLWMDPDHHRPFPDTAASIVTWLQTFKATGASPLTLRELGDGSICPSAFERPVRPVIANADPREVCGDVDK